MRPAANPPVRLPALPLAAAILVHAAGFAWAVTATKSGSEVSSPSQRRRTESPRMVVVFPMPATPSTGPRQATHRRAVSSQPTVIGEPQPEPSPDAAPSSGDGLVEHTTTSAQTWAWQPNASALNLAQANRRSVMADLPPRPDCDFYNVGPFQCLSLIAKWSLDSTYMVNLRCGQARPSERYAECGEAGKRAQSPTELHAQPR